MRILAFNTRVAVIDQIPPIHHQTRAAVTSPPGPKSD